LGDQTSVQGAAQLALVCRCQLAALTCNALSGALTNADQF
jgi:hypothetical protein